MRFALCAALAIIAGPAAPAFACMLCDSATAEQVRAQLFAGDFLFNAACVVAPFPILLAAIIYSARTR
jgi:hypothetical protein